MSGVVIPGLPPILIRLTGDFGSLGHEPPKALALAASTVRTWRGKVRPDTRKLLDSVLDDYGVARALAEPPIQEALDLFSPARASKTDLDKIRDAALHRRSLIEGLLRSMTGSDRATKDRAVEMSAQVLGTKPSNHRDAVEMLEAALARDRLILEATSAKRKKLVEAPAAGTTVKPAAKVAPTLGQTSTPVKKVGRDGKAVKDPEFEKKHPRAPKGREGGGTFALKKGTGMGEQQPEPMVTQLQQRLSGLGFKLAPDGRFGGVTEEAVKAFQRSVGLPETGEVDERTTETLRNPPMNADGTVRTVEQLRAEEKAAAGEKGTKPKSGGASNTAVEPKPNGYTEGDEESVKAFQKAHGLKVDGVVGPETRGAKSALDKGGTPGASGRDKGDAKAKEKGGGAGKGSGSDMIRRGDGMRGEVDKGVSTLQQSLQDLGFDLGEGGVDGRFGEETEAAVKKLQKRYGLRVDGVVGPQTQEWIRKLLKKKSDDDKVALGESQEEIVAKLTARLEEAVAARSAARSGEEFTRALARESVARERLDEATALRARGGGVRSWDPNLHPRNRVGQFQKVLSSLRVGDNITVGGVTVKKIGARRFTVDGQTAHGIDVAAKRTLTKYETTTNRYGHPTGAAARSALAHREGSDALKGGSRTTAADHLGEKVNYGGRMESRAAVIKDLQAKGVPQAGIDRYMQGLDTGSKSRGEDAVMRRAMGPKLYAEAGQKAAIKAKPESERTTEEKLSLLNIGSPGYGMRAHVRRTGENEWEISHSEHSSMRYERQYAKPMKGGAKEIAAEIDRATEEERQAMSAGTRSTADMSLKGGKSPFKGRVTLDLKLVPSDWAVEQGYAEFTDTSEKGLTFKRFKWKQGVDPERMVVHFLGGRKPPENFPEGTPAHAQWSFPGKAKNKAEKQALIRKLTEAFALRRDGHTDQYVGLLNEVLAECADEEGVQMSLDEATLDTAARKKLPTSSFAIPEKRAYPIHDEAHAKAALARVEQHGTPEEKAKVRAAVKRRYPSLMEGEVLEEVSSKSLPGLDKSPKENWVDKAGGLPSYIERVAKHLHYEKGMAMGRAIATAVNVAKKMCASGDTNFPGKQQVNAKSQAQACAAVAKWEKMKAKTHMKEAVLLIEAAEQTFPARELSMSLPEIDALLGEIEEAFREHLHPRDRAGRWRDVPYKGHMISRAWAGHFNVTNSQGDFVGGFKTEAEAKRRIDAAQTPGYEQVPGKPNTYRPKESIRSEGIERPSGGDLPSKLMGLGTGKHEITVGGVPFTLYYDEQGATGDSGAPVRGDKTGDWEVFRGHGGPVGLGPALARVHVSPHGSSGYGNDAAPRYAVEQVERAIMAEVRKSQSTDRVMGADAAVAVGRFNPGGPEGYKARTWPGAKVRKNKATAVEDERMYLENRHRDFSTGDLPDRTLLKYLTDEQIQQLVDRVIPQARGASSDEGGPLKADVAQEANRRATRRRNEGPDTVKSEGVTPGFKPDMGAFRKRTAEQIRASDTPEKRAKRAEHRAREIASARHSAEQHRAKAAELRKLGNEALAKDYDEMAERTDKRVARLSAAGGGTVQSEGIDTADVLARRSAARAAVTGESKREMKLRKIVSEHRATKIDGMLVDPTTANMLLKVLGALSPANRDRFDTVPLMSLVNLGWAHVK